MMNQLGQGDAQHTRSIADLESELWYRRHGTDAWCRAKPNQDWLQRNRVAQQVYNSQHEETRRVFDQECLAFEEKVRQAQDMLDEFLDADILPISKWALDLMEEAKRVRAEAEDLPSGAEPRGEDD